MLFFISPSGLGVREGVYAVTLDFAFKDDFPDDYAGVAAAFAIVIRFWQTLVEIGLVAHGHGAGEDPAYQDKSRAPLEEETEPRRSRANPGGASATVLNRIRAAAVL